MTKFSPEPYEPIRSIAGGFSLSVIFDSAERMLNWSINISKNQMVYVQRNGYIPSYSFKKIEINDFFGFGPVIIDISVNEKFKEYNGFLVGPLLFCLQER